MRRLESIQNFLEHRRNAIPFLFDGYPLQQVCLIAQRLLIDGIFISETLAKQRFPLLFDPARHLYYSKASSDKTPSETMFSEKGSSEKDLSEKASSVTNMPEIKTGSYQPEVTGADEKLASPESEAKSVGEAVTLDLATQHTGESSIAES